MPKIKIKIVIQNSNETIENTTMGIYSQGVLKYLEEEKTKVTYHYKNHQLLRENDEYKMTFDFEKGNLKTKLKEYQTELNIEIKNIIIKEDNKNIIIEYEIDKERFIYRIEEVI
ncbi:MAG: hypothetical protein IJG68_06270 [Bacilli bacterium]|nr:hypothetical protein [Bacilli bacterium]